MKETKKERKVDFSPLMASCLSFLDSRCTLIMTSSGDGMILTFCGFLEIRLSSRMSGCFPIPITSILALESRKGCEALSSGVMPSTWACRPVVIRTTILAADGLDCPSCCAAAARALSMRLIPFKRPKIFSNKNLFKNNKNWVLVFALIHFFI